MPTSLEKVLVFDIWSDFGHFRKIETTTSPLTYSIPTPTALSGIIAAMVGLARDSYYNIFTPDKISFAIKPLSPLRKIGININLIKTDDGFYLWDINGTPRSPTPFEFLKTPSYRIYMKVVGDDKEAEKLYEDLKNLLEKHNSYYTPFLGISGMIAEFKFVGEFPSKIKGKTEKVDTLCVVRKDKFKLVVEKDKKYILERIPFYMNNERIVQRYIDVIFEADNKPISVRADEVYEISDENVIFL